MRRAAAGGSIGVALLLAACATFSLAPVSLSLDEQIGQLFVPAARGVFVNEQSPEWRGLVRQVREDHVGGFIWFGADVYETAWLNARLQRLARVPLLLSADLEAGVGMRFGHTTWWPWPMAVAATNDPTLAEREGRVVGEEARALGLNQVLAPVADVNVDPENPDINVRSYGDDPKEVARYVAAFIRGVQAAGVLATAKHFPGQGATRTDSHRSLPKLDLPRERLDALELVPFRAAIAAGVGAILTAHVSLPALDPEPAPARGRGLRERTEFSEDSEVASDATVPGSLSPRVTAGLLRRELGYGGLVLIDAADMGALTDHYDPGEVAVRAILAGADQIPKSPDVGAGIAAVRRAVETGRLSRARLEESVARILAAKRRAGSPTPDPERVFRLVDSPAHRALAQEIARRSITLVREAPGVLPLGRAASLLHVLVTEPGERIGADLARELEARLDRPPESVVLDARSREEDVTSVLEKASGRDAVLVSFFVRPQSGRGRLALSEPARRAVAGLLASGARVVGVAFGSPYVLREVPELPTYLVAWGSQSDAQAAAVRALFGEAAIEGRLPVSLGALAARGSGILRPASTAPPR